MFIEQYDPRAHFTHDNALKILLRLINEYAPEEDETGYFAWNQAEKALRDNPERIPQAAQATHELIAPIIEMCLEDIDTRLRIFKAKAKFALETNIIAEISTTTSPELSFLFEATSYLHERHENEITHLKLLRGEYQADLRSLDRALRALTREQEMPCTQYDTLIAIMRCG